MNIPDFYTIKQAAAWLTKSKYRETEIEKSDIFTLVKSGKLHVCLEFNDVLGFVSICNPEGVIQQRNLSLRIDGWLRSLDPPPCADSAESCWTVEVFYVISQDGRCFLPTTEETCGYMKPGYVVNGMTDYMEVPLSNWLFCFKDLENLVGSNAPIHYEQSAPAAIVEAVPASMLEPKTDAGQEEKISKGLDCPPFLNKGANKDMSKVDAWVKYQAEALVKAGDKITDLCSKIRLEAERCGYESARGNFTNEIIRKMLPEKSTGGRGKNGGKSKK
jgi:hypothetical protein